ncbi:MAG: hypothetical protein KDD11_18215, partial [Acidobacteria bacterium]|nr:hypothetical protein [Acidobacteriota bacterium]
IGLDHRKQLGSTLSAIAGEKAGILRSQTPAFAWVGRPTAKRALARRARDLGCPLADASQQVRVLERRSRGWSGQEIRLETERGDYRFELALPGEHQARNLGLAVRAAETLADLGWPGLGPRSFERGIAACRWPGRLESMVLPDGDRPHAGRPPADKQVVLEAAHNADGAAQLIRFLEAVGEPVDLLFGALEDKRPWTFLPRLAAGCRRVVLTTPPGERGMAAGRLRRWLPAAHPVVVEEDPGRALDAALAEGGVPLLVCGSIYLIGAIRTRLRERFGVPAPAAEIRLGPAPDRSQTSSG